MKAIIFDMDGVLIDSEPMHMEIEQRMLQSIGVEISEEEMSQFIGTASQQMWETLINRYELKQSIDELHGVLTDYKTKYFSDEDLEAIPGVKELLVNIKANNIKLAVASSSPLEHINIIIEKLKIKDFFEIVVSGDHVEMSKPNPEIFHLAAKRLGVNPSECVVIEDSTHGVSAAKAAGMTCVAYDNPNSLNQVYDKADLVVAHIENIDLDLLLG